VPILRKDLSYQLSIIHEIHFAAVVWLQNFGGLNTHFSIPFRLFFLPFSGFPAEQRPKTFSICPLQAKYDRKAQPPLRNRASA